MAQSRDEPLNYFPALLFILVSSLVLSFILLTLEHGSKYSTLLTVLSVLVLFATILAGFSYFLRAPTFMFYSGVITLLGVGLRISSVLGAPGEGSDVLTASVEAAKLMLVGINPYTTLYYVGPNQQYLAYPPFEPIFYIPFMSVDPRWAEALSGSFILVTLLLIGLKTRRTESLLYLALYSFSPLLLAIVAFSTNDTSASLFPFLGTALLMFSNMSKEKRLTLAGILLGLGVGFKQFGIFPLIFILAYLVRSREQWPRFLISTAVTISVIMLPFLILSPALFLRRVFFFHITTRFLNPQFVLWALNPEFFGTWSLLVQFGLSAGAGVFLLIRSRSWVEYNIAWTIEMLLFLFLGRYFAPGYFAYVMPFWILAGYASPKLEGVLRHGKASVNGR